MSMGFSTIKNDIDEMAAAQSRTLLETGKTFHQGRYICGFTVALTQAGEYMVGSILRTHSSTEVAEYIWARI